MVMMMTFVQCTVCEFRGSGVINSVSIIIDVQSCLKCLNASEFDEESDYGIIDRPLCTI